MNYPAHDKVEKISQELAELPKGCHATRASLQTQMRELRASLQAEEFQKEVLARLERIEALLSK